MNNNIDTLYDRLAAGEEKLALIGLGYVGMPIAVEFAKHISVIGFNHNEHRIQQYKNGVDPTNEVGNEEIKRPPSTLPPTRSVWPRQNSSLWRCPRPCWTTTIRTLSR